MRKLAIAVIVGSLTLVGCATQDYTKYVETQREIEVVRAQARAAAEVARYQALAEIARSGDTTARVAAVISLQAGGQGGQAQQQPQLNAPVSNADYALRWAGVLLPSLTQGYGIYQTSRVAITQSNNATQLGMRQSDNTTALGVSTNNAFVGIAGSGFTAASQIAAQNKANVTITGNTGSSINAGNSGAGASGSVAWQPLSGTGVIGNGSYADTRDQSNRPSTVTSTSTSTTTNTTNNDVVPQPTVQ